MGSFFFEGVEFIQVGARAWIANGCFCGGVLRVVKSGETVFGCAEVAVVEGVGMHLHEHHDAMKCEKDLGGPGPAEHERPVDPQSKPSGLVNTLNGHSGLFPPQPFFAIPEQFV